MHGWTHLSLRYRMPDCLVVLMLLSLVQMRLSVAAAMLAATPGALGFTTPVGSLASPVKTLHSRWWRRPSSLPCPLSLLRFPAGIPAPL
jgi:hypothetical protein